MPSWNDLLDECRQTGSGHDVVRRKYLKKLSDHTKRNVIVYYSGWLQKGELSKQGIRGFDVNDADKTGFMATINNLDRSLGLDLVLHTPGGEMAATESLVEYLRSMFGTDIRAIVPQLAMSAGTMMALSCKQIVMGKHSSLGPIDPQIGGVPAHGIIEEVKKTVDEVTKAPFLAPLYQMIFAKYGPTLIGEAQKSIDWAHQIVTEWLKTGMFAADPATASAKAAKVLDGLGDHALTLSHARHISIKMAKDLDLKVIALEDDDDLQEAVLSVHHACIQTFSATPAIKIIENHKGIAYIESRAQAVLVSS
ncbi:MAG: SDH family Clp fold serine proteinase [Polyangiaceae bacterium]